jgi:hypothetical protein
MGLGDDVTRYPSACAAPPNVPRGMTVGDRSRSPTGARQARLTPTVPVRTTYRRHRRGSPIAPWHGRRQTAALIIPVLVAVATRPVAGEVIGRSAGSGYGPDVIVEMVGISDDAQIGP